MVRARELLNNAVRHPPAAAHRGEPAVAYRRTFWSLSDSLSAVPSSLDSGEPFCTR